MAHAEIRRHNELVLSSLEEGDLVQFPHLFYSHYAVYIGGGDVVHLTGDPNAPCSANSNPAHLFSVCGSMFAKAIVKREKFLEVAGDSMAIKLSNNDTEAKRKMTVQRALSKIGEVGYNVLWKNCECFARSCRCGGVGFSTQTFDFVGSIAAFSAVGAAAEGPVGAVVGAVVGASVPFLARGFIIAYFGLLHLQMKMKRKKANIFR